MCCVYIEYLLTRSACMYHQLLEEQGKCSFPHLKVTRKLGRNSSKYSKVRKHPAHATDSLTPSPTLLWSTYIYIYTLYPLYNSTLLYILYST